MYKEHVEHNHFFLLYLSFFSLIENDDDLSTCVCVDVRTCRRQWLAEEINYQSSEP